MQKGQKVILLLVLYSVLSWLTRGHSWAPPPLVAPASVAHGLTPQRHPSPASDDALPSHQRPAIAGPALAIPDATTATAAAGEGEPPPDSWDAFLAKLRALERGKRNKVRAIHLGDSELVGDGTSGSVRRELAARYGLGGLGFSLAMLPLPWYRREHWRHHEGLGFKVYSYPHGSLDGGMYGPGGVAFDSPAGSRAQVTMRHPVAGPCTVQFFYSHVPAGGDVKLYADGALLHTVSTNRPRAGLGVLSKKLLRCPRELELNTAARHTRVYGWSIEYDAAGIVWSSLGIVSAQLAQLAHYDEPHLHETLAALRPDLVVMTFGLNLAAAPYPPPQSYQHEAQQMLRRVRKGTPNAACLVTGPYPVGYKPREGGYHPDAASAKVISRYQRAAAEAAGCVFLDRHHLAGGGGAARRWRVSRPKILGGDYQHLTVEGGDRMGRAIAGAILASLDGGNQDLRALFALERQPQPERR